MWFIEASAGFSDTVICFLSIYAVNLWCLIFISIVLVINYQFRIEYISWHEYYISWCGRLFVRYIELINETQAEWIYVQPKMKICFKFTHLQAIQDVDEFVSPSEPIWRKFKVKKKKKSFNLFYKQLFATQDVYW